ncbi:uncharacterized protein LOC111699013 isoform X2 [Eurytemora carolleeae]|uniref:uncharacterized protein LOC111699013 isoform X2 n=1 Tax=Eurytemora carolleeae TaxID=1294199 RepID=UPI000C78714B|nr:uncharacterized protein LOC111699013 isoform X2 [Eurytemora carolleeae]|eukprot:XP_023325304.1 uncharacterized protein LOC111699013 isoform X2 [Eurytemora affinis]
MENKTFSTQESENVFPNEARLIENEGKESRNEMKRYNGSHSSEEELEEINIRNEFGLGVTEKRKWGDLTDASSESDLDTLESLKQAEYQRYLAEFSSSTLSEDNDNNQDISAPVQFSTSPPLDVHKPRQCDSPVVPIAGLDFSNRHRLTDNQHQHQLTNNQHPLQLTNNQQAIHASNGVQLSSALRRITGVNEAKEDNLVKLEETLNSTTERKIISPRKKSRKVHLLSRPCLDFEKMQKMQTVTTWQSGELTLFCW